MSPYEAFWGTKPQINWLRTFRSKCWALIPKPIRRKGDFRSIEGIFVGYFDNSKAYKIWVPQTRSILKARDIIFDELNHIERVTIHSTDEDDLPNLWTTNIHMHITPIETLTYDLQWTKDQAFPFTPGAETTERDEETQGAEREEEMQGMERGDNEGEVLAKEDEPKDEDTYAPKDFERGPCDRLGVS
jgi:hypothetical protein